MAELQGIEAAGPHDLVATGPEDDASNDADQHELEQAEAEPHRAGEREDAAEAAERIEAADVGADAFGNEEKANLKDVREHAGENDEAEERQHDAGEAQQDRVKMGHHGALVGRKRGDFLQLAAHEAGCEVDEPPAEHQKEQHACD